MLREKFTGFTPEEEKWFKIPEKEAEEKEAMYLNAVKTEVDRALRTRVENALADLNEALEKKGFKRIPLEAVDAALESFESEIELEARASEEGKKVLETGKGTEKFVKQWVERIGDDTIKSTLQEASRKFGETEGVV